MPSATMPWPTRMRFVRAATAARNSSGATPAIRFRISSLRRCSAPGAAPASMVAQYGPANGFGWQLNEVIGAQIVSVPLGVPLERVIDAVRAANSVNRAGYFELADDRIYLRLNDRIDSVERLANTVISFEGRSFRLGETMLLRLPSGPGYAGQVGTW